MTIGQFLLSIFIAIVLRANELRGYRSIVFWGGVIVDFTSFNTIGNLMLASSILSYFFDGVVFAYNNIKTSYNNMKWRKATSTNAQNAFDNIIRTIKETVFDDAGDVKNIIDELSEINQDVLNEEQILQLRKITADLWKKYFDLKKQGKYRNNNRSSSYSSYNSESFDPYKILGISRDASSAEIRRAYIKMCKKWHPDVNHSKNAEIKFKEVQKAYDALQ